MKGHQKQTVRQPYGRYHSRHIAAEDAELTTVVATVGLSDGLFVLAFQFHLPRKF